MTTRTALFSRNQPGGVFTIEDLRDHPGDIWFVDSGAAGASDAAGAGKSPDVPFATLDYAIAKCTASNGDVIYVMPGHAETLGADSAVDVDVIGVKIIGLGWGATRPTFNATAIAGDFKLAAASISIENLLFTGGVDATTGMLEISAADCRVKNCEFRDVTGQATDCLITVDGADRLTIEDCKFIMAAGAGANSAIALDGSDDCEIKNCYIYGNFAVAAIDLRTTLSARVNIHDCKLWTANAADIAIKDTITSSTGFIGPNLQIMLTDNAANITTAVTGATFQMIDPVYICNLVNEKAMLSNWTASTHA
ncbi:MAG TPA: hypothetical protein DCP69_04095 [Candidatus Omnitrophica bacterium]|nr:hypothetical protein [Candidatus Omnitrophota bacterium]